MIITEEPMNPTCPATPKPAPHDRNTPSPWNPGKVLLRQCQVIQAKHREHWGVPAVVIQEQKSLKRGKNSSEGPVNIQSCNEANLHCINSAADALVVCQSVLATSSST